VEFFCARICMLQLVSASLAGSPFKLVYRCKDSMAAIHPTFKNNSIAGTFNVCKIRITTGFLFANNYLWGEHTRPFYI